MIFWSSAHDTLLRMTQEQAKQRAFDAIGRIVAAAKDLAEVESLLLQNSETRQFRRKGKKNSKVRLSQPPEAVR